MCVLCTPVLRQFSASLKVSAKLGFLKGLGSDTRHTLYLGHMLRQTLLEIPLRDGSTAIGQAWKALPLQLTFCHTHPATTHTGTTRVEKDIVKYYNHLNCFLLVLLIAHFNRIQPQYKLFLLIAPRIITLECNSLCVPCSVIQIVRWYTYLRKLKKTIICLLSHKNSFEN